MLLHSRDRSSLLARVPSAAPSAKPSMEKRAFFRNRTLAWLLIAPQLLLVFLFFYWPAAQALYWAFTLEQPWGGGNVWVGLENFEALFADDAYWNSIAVSFAYAGLATGIA